MSTQGIACYIRRISNIILRLNCGEKVKSPHHRYPELGVSQAIGMPVVRSPIALIP